MLCDCVCVCVCWCAVWLQRGVWLAECGVRCGGVCGVVQAGCCLSVCVWSFVAPGGLGWRVGLVPGSRLGGGRCRVGEELAAGGGGP